MFGLFGGGGGAAKVATQKNEKILPEGHEDAVEVDPAEGVSKAGTYQVIVKIVEAKELFAIQRFSLAQLKMNLVSRDRVPSAFVRLKLIRGDGTQSVRQRSPVRKNTSTPLFESLFYFNDIHVAEGELASVAIQIAAFDRGLFGPHLRIGSIDLDLESIHQLPGHELWRTWLTLADPSGRREGPQGMVMACITVLSRTDKQADHSLEEDDEAGEVGGEDGAPPDLSFGLFGAKKELAKLEREDFGLRLEAFMARDVPKMDWNAPSGFAGVSPYVQITVGSKSARTRRRVSRDPQWRQEIGLTMQLPPGGAGAPPIRIQLMDHNFTTADKPIAAFRLNFLDVLSRPDHYRKARWYPLYGAPREPEEQFSVRTGAKLARRMNCGFVEGNTYRGTLYMTIYANRAEKLPPVRRRAIAMTDSKPPANYVLLFEALSLDVPLPEEGGLGSECMVEMTYGLTSTRTAMWYEAKGNQAANGDVFVTFGEKVKPTNVLVPEPYDGPEAGTSAPDIFINVWWSSSKTKKRRVSYGRVPMAVLLPALLDTEFPEEGPEGAAGGRFAYQGWLQLKADSLSTRKGSSTIRGVRPQGAILVRLQLTKKPSYNPKIGGDKNKPYIVGVTAQEEEAAKVEAERALLKLKGELEDSDEDEEADAKNKKKPTGPGFFEVGGTFGAAPEPEVVQAFNTRPYKLHVFVYQAIGVPATDSTGSSDPFCIVRCGHSVGRTQVCASTTSPAWFAEVVLEVQLPVCSRPDTMSFGAMVHNAKYVDRARRQMTAAIYKPPPYHPVKNEDLPAIAEPDATGGGRLLRRGGARPAARAEEMDVRKPGDPGATQLGADQEDELEDVQEDVEDGEILFWACPNIFLTVYDKGSRSDEALSVCWLPLSKLGGKEATGGKDTSGQLSRSLGLRWYDMHAFEFLGARKNKDPTGGGGKILASFSLEGPTDSMAAVLDRRKKAAYKPPPVESDYDGGCMGGGKKAGRGNAPLGLYRIPMPYKPMEVEVLLLGVRAMQPMMGLPIVSPSVEVEITGVMPIILPDTGAPPSRCAMTSKHSGVPSGANANYKGQILRIRCRFSTSEDVIPGITLRVRDKRLGAAPLIGVANVTPLPSPAEGGAGPSKEELEAANDAWAFMGKRYGSEGTLSDVSIQSGFSKLAKTDDGRGELEVVKEEEDDDDEEPAAAGPADDEAGDVHGTGDIPLYMVGRQSFPYELEDDLGEPPFHTVPVMRIGGDSDELQEVGRVKFCLRRVPLAPEAIPGQRTAAEAEKMGKYIEMDHLAAEASLADMAVRVAASERLFVRVYVLRGMALQPKSSKGLAEPYVTAVLGNKKLGDRRDAIKDTVYPPFYKIFEFKPSLPGAGTLSLKVFSVSEALLDTDGDDLIGETTIDLEDRWYSELWAAKWQELPPLERRSLRLHPEGGTCGQLELFVEIMLQMDAARRPALDITPPPPEMVELRVVIWQARNMDNKKVIMSQNDLFFKCVVQGTDRLGKVFLQERSTDIHWFSSGGGGNFNYRLMWRFELPMTKPKLKISGWNKDIVGTTDETIGEFTENLSKRCGTLLDGLKKERAKNVKDENVDQYEPAPSVQWPQGKKWVKLYHPSNKGDHGPMHKPNGEVEIQWSLMTVKKADARPVGEGQDEPNRDPVLPRPERATLNLLDPMGSLATIIGPDRLRLIVMVLILIVVGLVTGAMAFMILNDYLQAIISEKIYSSGGSGGSSKGPHGKG